MCFVENFTIHEAEKCFVHVINTINNNTVGNGLSTCGILQEATLENLKLVLTTYKMSCLIVRIILCMNNADFETLCGHIANQEQVKQLSNLYHGKYICIHQSIYTYLVSFQLCYSRAKFYKVVICMIHF